MIRRLTQIFDRQMGHRTINNVHCGVEGIPRCIDFFIEIDAKLENLFCSVGSVIPRNKQLRLEAAIRHLLAVSPVIESLVAMRKKAHSNYPLGPLTGSIVVPAFAEEIRDIHYTESALTLGTLAIGLQHRLGIGLEA